MKTLTPHESLKILLYLCADCSINPTQEQATIWITSLSHIGVDEAWDAAKLYLLMGMYTAPRVAEFMEALRELRRNRQAGVIPSERLKAEQLSRAAELILEQLRHTRVIRTMAGSGRMIPTEEVQ